MVLRRWVLVGGYASLVLLGVAAAGWWRSPAGAPAGVLLLGIGVAGLYLALVLPRAGRRRPPVDVGVAPSGLPATFLPRRADVVVASVVVTLALAGWSGWVAWLLAAHGRPGWAVAAAASAVVLLVPCAAAATGRVSPGGLWLTAAGVEHRRETTTWAVRWSDVQRVHPEPAGYAAESGLVPVEPVVLRLRPGVRPEVRRTARWAWKNRSAAAPPGAVRIDTFGLAGDQWTVIGLVVERLATRP